ncbi:50S ribosomal protein L17 [Solirubrum puertoriconensis]|uniref:Large ribosomal subunit protein bL17 n=1 Tax=Solirubrum puertoriconensis TaxID=1751427 RepID=A0A9X0HIF5_SOLP1|nr:50S ribosomal protein L17 [Solirubrum puertoriconensis]KUG06498.1 50S ribosomal protein L17 [Solirubrum puertoriconensis]
MRHGKKDNHLGRTTAHRGAMLSNMASSLILHKRITTTTAKAKELRKYVEPLLTRSKEDTTHSRRMVFAELQNKESIKELFGEVAGKIANRPGGYTRIIKLSAGRAGDNADMCIIELVDYNETLLEAKNAGAAKTTTRRSRRGGKKAEGAAAPAATTEATPAPEAPAADAASTEEAAS